jgi:hypothetical protein
MSDRDQLYPLDQTVWLLAIGRRLQVEYDAIAEPQTSNTLSRKDWHSAANRAVLCSFRARRAPRDPAPPADR